MAPILEVKDLHVQFFTRDGVVKAVNGANFTLHEGQVLGLVGESGSGKTVTALSILRLVPYPGRMIQGEILYAGRRLGDMDDEAMRHVRGKEIAMVFQDATAALNPILSVGTQMEEVLLAHTDVSRRRAQETAMELLEEIGLPEPRHLMGQYPFQLSGGMAQRVMLAMALSLRPKVLIADEPTSNLDVTLQADILQRLRRLQREQNSSILLITHDMGVVANMADDVAVMYAGSMMEFGEVNALFHRPVHPYTWSLFQALPRMDEAERNLRPIRGVPPNLIDLPDQCPFLPRCPKATVDCRINPRPPLEEVESDHLAACYNQVVYD